jgi:hypothetical protein
MGDSENATSSSSAPAPVMAGAYVELRSSSSHCVHNVLVVDWEALGRPQSIEEMQAIADKPAKLEAARAAAAAPPAKSKAKK